MTVVVSEWSMNLTDPSEVLIFKFYQINLRSCSIHDNCFLCFRPLIYCSSHTFIPVTGNPKIHNSFEIKKIHKNSIKLILLFLIILFNFLKF